MTLLDIHCILMQVKSICVKKKTNQNPNLWIFLDDDRIDDEISFLKNLPFNRSLGVVVRTKNNRNLYKKSKMVGKIAKLKGFKLLVSSNSQIALSVGAFGVHFPKEIKKNRMHKTLFYSCSFHEFSDVRRVIDLKVKTVFISPIFKTTSDKKKKPIGLTRLLFLSRSLKCDIGVLGGISKKNIKKFRKKNISHFAGVNMFLSN